MALPPGEPVPGVRRLDDVHLRGLLTLLADDPRLTAFADRELAALRDQPELVRTLRAVVEHAGRKSAAASSLNISGRSSTTGSPRSSVSSARPSTTPSCGRRCTWRSSRTTSDGPS